MTECVSGRESAGGRLERETAAIVLAAGKGTRMVGYNGNKTLLPLIPTRSIFDGDHPLLLEVLANLPPGPVGIVVHHHAEAVRSVVGCRSQTTFIEQPTTNGTGGALLACRPFLEQLDQDGVIITMGDVPLIRSRTYSEMIEELDRRVMVVLGFRPADRSQYGLLEMEGEGVSRIVEWKYWKGLPPDRLERLQFCNAGVYAVRRRVLLDYLGRLARQPHVVQKQMGDRWEAVEEFFLTDLVELISGDGWAVGLVLADEAEVSGVDTPEALRSVQLRYARERAPAP